MNKICTDIEQSKKLIELGLDVSTADMLWTYDFTVNDINGLNVISKHLKPEEKDVPAWSLTALLELIHNNSYILRNTGVETNRYHIWAIQRKSPVWCETPLDAAFEMVCWLKENNKL